MSRHFVNPYSDYVPGSAVKVDEVKIKQLIQKYVADIVKNADPKTTTDKKRSDIYVGDSGERNSYKKI